MTAREGSNGQEDTTRIAYFSMEIAIDPSIPTYSGGLGILAGDILRSAADMGVGVIGVTLCYDMGYGHQMLDSCGGQSTRAQRWKPEGVLTPLNVQVEMIVDGRPLTVGGYLYEIKGRKSTVPVYLLTTNLNRNSHDQRRYTEILYTGDKRVRIIQEVILGIGGVRFIEEIHGDSIQKYHMNEGHSAFLTLELYKRYGHERDVKERCIFTTHTPLPGGHEVHSWRMTKEILGEDYYRILAKIGEEDRDINMSELALKMSGYTNAVSRKHREVTLGMFPSHEIDYITNGIHIGTWLHPVNRDLYENYIPGFIANPQALGNAMHIPSEELWRAHERIKEEFTRYIGLESWQLMDKDTFTIGFARRMTAYKRPTLIFSDLDRLGTILKDKGQIVIAGKSHPEDLEGQALIKEIFKASDYLWDNYGVGVVFLQNYNMALARNLVAGVDLWLNTPKRYLEASGTSGMKAALNAVPNLSVLDGWWIEAYEMCGGKGGWAIGPGPEDPDAVNRSDREDADDIYNLLENEIIPRYYSNRSRWIDVMKRSITLASYFNAHRVVDEYKRKAWSLGYSPF